MTRNLSQEHLYFLFNIFFNNFVKHSRFRYYTQIYKSMRNIIQ